MAPDQMNVISDFLARLVEAGRAGNEAMAE